MNEPIQIANLLEVRPGDVIMIPHCEAPSQISTLRFAAHYAAGNCRGGLVQLQDALEALPGSEIIYGTNFGPPNFRGKWLKLPPIDAVCPCPGYPDFYAILRELPRVGEEEVQEGPCPTEVSEWCSDSADFMVPPAPDTYFEDGEFPGAAGFLPPVSPYEQSAYYNASES